MINNKPRPVMYSIPEYVQEALRLYAAKQDTTRSAIVKTAIIEYLGVRGVSVKPTTPQPKPSIDIFGDDEGNG